LSDRHNETKIQTHQVLSHTHVENPATNMLSPRISHSTNIVPQRTEIISNTNFSSIPHIKQSNNVQTQENVTDCIRIIRDNNFENKQNSTDHISLSQEINKPEINSDILSSSSMKERLDFSNESEMPNSLMKDSTSSALHTERQTAYKQTARRN